MCFFVNCTDLLFALRTWMHNQALFVGPFLKRLCRCEIKPHCLAFMQTIKENPTLERKKWPQLPCLAQRFTVFSVDSIVQGLHSASGASIGAAEGNIELSASCVNSGLPPGRLCTHPSPLLAVPPRGPLSQAVGSSIQTRSRSFVSERVTFAKGEHPSAGNSGERAKWHVIGR